jgi:hypothetical protein
VAGPEHGDSRADNKRRCRDAQGLGAAGFWRIGIASCISRLLEHPPVIRLYIIKRSPNQQGLACQGKRRGALRTLQWLCNFSPFCWGRRASNIVGAHHGQTTWWIKSAVRTAHRHAFTARYLNGGPRHVMWLARCSKAHLTNPSRAKLSHYQGSQERTIKDIL